MCWPFKRVSGSLATFCFPGMERKNLIDFHGHVLWGLLFPVQEPWVGASGMGPGTPDSREGTSATEVSLLAVSHSPFCVSAPPTGLSVASYIINYRGPFS